MDEKEEELPDFEIDWSKIEIVDVLPKEWDYPEDDDWD